MRAVVQRVKDAQVTVDGKGVGNIRSGLVVLLGVAQEDTEKDADYLAAKTAGLRIFPDDQSKMNRSVTDVGGEVMVISQFTLCGDVRRGKRPSFATAAPPDLANTLYERFVSRLREAGIQHVATGVFQAMMDVTLTNSGPVTILLDSRKAF